MADKQLTVAELMARAQKENPDAQPRRRRRRSLDEGGVSVAELTGSLKAVDARPAEVKHSNVPIDAENADRPQRNAPVASSVKVAPAQKPVDEPAPTATPTRTPEPQPQPQTQPQLQARPDTRPVSRPVPKPSAAPSTPVVRDEKSEEKAGDRPAEGTTLRKFSLAETRAAGKADPALPFNQDTDETNVIPVVKAAPAAKRSATRETPVRDTELVEEDAVVAEEIVDKRPAETEFDEQAELDGLDTLDAAEPVYEDYADYDGEVDTSVNPIMLVLLVFAGLLVGVLVFLGFQYLWGALNSILVAVLALAATAGIVFAVRGMKTGNDGLTLTLAGLAGAAMTFGPALISAF